MARDISEIKKQMTDEFVANPTIISIYGLTSGKTFEQEFSKVSLESILFYVVAFCAWVIENLFDQHKKEVEDKLAQQRVHKPEWYRQKALLFRKGQALINVDESDVYDDTGLTEDDIEAMQIIKQCAVFETDETVSRLIVKIATTDGSGNLIPVTNIAPDYDKDKFEIYMKTIRDVGVKISVVNQLADKLYLNLRVYINPLVLNADGSLVGNPTKFPVVEAVYAFLPKIPFNGELVLASLVDDLQQVNGVKIPHIDSASSSWITGMGYGAITPIDVKKIPESGYFKIETLNITYHVA